MLLDRLNEETIASLRKQSGAQQDFHPEKYSMFFQYDTAAGAIKYMAVRNDPMDDSIPFGYCFSLRADLTVHHGNAYPWLPLLLYLREYEKGLSEDHQKEIYGEAFYDLASAAGLSRTEMAERENARRSFLAFLERIREKGMLKEENPDHQKLTLRIELEELPEGSKPLSFRMKIGQKDGKLYYMQNAKAFFQALKTGGELSVRSGFSTRVTPDAFEEAWQPLMGQIQGIAHASTASGRSQYFLVSRDQIPALFSLLPKEEQGAGVFSGQGPWTIREEEAPACVSMDSAGSLSFQPDIQNCRTKPVAVISGRQMILLHAEKKEAVLYRFEDHVTAELYGYFSERSSKEVGYVSDLLIQKVLPVSSGILRKSETNVFHIAVYISLEGEVLQFHTEYWIGEEKKESSFFEGKPFEQALIHSCASVLQSLHGKVNGSVEKPEDVLFFLQSDLEPLRKIASVYVDERIRRLKIRTAPTVQIRAARSRGWLNLSFHSSEFTQDELERIYAAFRKKKAFFLLKDNLILLDPEKMEQTEEIIEGASAEKNFSNVRLPFYHAMLLEGYREAGMDISMDKYVTEALSGVVGYKSAQLHLTENLKDVLRPYQQDGVRWMSRLNQYGFSGILADDMGLGKTLEVLAFLASATYEKPVLIVCPKSLVYNWRNEIRKWLGDVPVVMIAGKKNERVEMISRIPGNEKVFCIAGYDSLRLDVDNYQEKSFFLTVVDEAQNVKNASTQKAKAIRRISSDMRIALTGTPVENSLKDLWSICDYLMPGYLGTEAAFQKKYEQGDCSAQARADLARKVAPFLLRRRKEDVLDSLPEKEIIQVAVSLTDQQRGIYEAQLHKARELAETEKGVSVFSALTRLRQICVDPSVFLENYDEIPAKLSVALDLVMSSIENGHQILVFSSFTRVLEHFRYYLEERDIRSYIISGNTPGALRVEMAEKFNKEDRIRVMLVSIKAGGTGLNLTGADIVIHLDPWWNFAVEEQATDRAHRIGQTKPVTVYKLIAHDSIEEKVVSLQEEKRQTSEDVIQTSLEGIDAITPEDIRFILQ